MDQIKDSFYALLRMIDSGVFFKKPMQWLYLLTGILSFLPPLCCIVIFFAISKIVSPYMEGWGEALFYIMMFLLVVVSIILGYFSFLFWQHRSNRLGNAIKDYDDISALPVWGHYLQTSFEYWGLFSVIVPAIGFIAIFLYAFLSFNTYIFANLGYEFFHIGSEMGDYFAGLIGALVTLAFIILGLCILGYVMVLISHVIGENIRIKANIANDTRDMGDILRAATMNENELLKEKAPVLEEEKENEAE
ncbi:MAG: hypothetical protein HUK12_08115 [Muribaculaceae bacterium]|nr:hypothetical protein [Muribaculaceae bacterium]